MHYDDTVPFTRAGERKAEAIASNTINVMREVKYQLVSEASQEVVVVVEDVQEEEVEDVQEVEEEEEVLKM